MERKDAAYREATRSLLRQRLDHSPPLLLDGAIGSELERRGVPASLPLWSSHALLTHPEVVAALHADYVAAGAEILTANSFRTQRRTLTRVSPPARLGERDAELTALAVALARQAARDAERRVFVAGSAAPLEDCFSPALVPDGASLYAEHTRHAQNLAEAGVDLILIETMNCVREAVAAARAAHATGLAFRVSFVSWRSALQAGARLIGGCCGTRPEHIRALARRLAAC